MGLTLDDAEYQYGPVSRKVVPSLASLRITDEYRLEDDSPATLTFGDIGRVLCRTVPVDQFPSYSRPAITPETDLTYRRDPQCIDPS